MTISQSFLVQLDVLGLILNAAGMPRYTPANPCLQNGRTMKNDFISGTVMGCNMKKPNCTHAKDGPRMHDGLTGKEQSLYFSEDHPTMPGWFKGME